MIEPRRQLIGSLALIAWAVAGCGRDTPTPPGMPSPAAEFASAGAELFEKHCASCHGSDARGYGSASRVLRTPLPDLRLIAARRGGRFPEGEIGRFIDGRYDLAAHGSREMPIWATRFADFVPDLGIGDDVARGRIWSLVTYLRTIQD
jgi:mono/diheme cytochrome c family protein